MKTSRIKNMSPITILLILAIAATPASGTPSGSTRNNLQDLDPQLESFSINSRALAQGRGEANGAVPLFVLLPKSYSTQSQKRYPVVYTFHGHSLAPDQLIVTLRPYLQQAAGGEAEVIIVGVAGFNTFYANSPLNGNAEQMVREEVVPVIDGNYRTIARPEGRVVAGFSMGGFGAWNLGLLDPQVFGYVWSVCPGVFDATGLKEAVKVWSVGFYADYSRTFAGELLTPGARVPKPKFNGTDEDKRLVSLLEAGFGNVSQKLKAYGELPHRLIKVRFDVGRVDYDWITRGSHALAQKMKEAGINVQIEEHPNAGHQVSDAMIRNGFFPLMREVMAGLK